MCVDAHAVSGAERTPSMHATPAGEIVIHHGTARIVMKRIEPGARWKDLRVSHATLLELRRIPARPRAKHGIGALFSGTERAEKLRAAEVLAAEMNLPLYRVDLTLVVGGYIGETEKNLARIFAAVEPGGAVLFFDEADALFGKRTAVADTHDRYANQEVSYLLQRLESFPGLAILATSGADPIDPAALRLFRHVVEFGTPGPGKSP